jgi:hypothetical protein
MLLWIIILYATGLSLAFSLLQASTNEIAGALALFTGLMIIKYLWWRWRI